MEKRPQSRHLAASLFKNAHELSRQIMVIAKSWLSGEVSYLLRSSGFELRRAQNPCKCPGEQEMTA
eukprot:420913-Pelagomonas_calceolata.AAC.1